MSSGHAGYAHATTSFFGRDRARQGGPEAWTIWILATIFVVWLFAIQTGYGIVSPDIQKDADLTLSQISSAASVYTVAFAIVQFFSGSLLDRYGTRPLMAIAVALVTAGAFLFAGTTSFATLVAAQIVLAVGASFGFVGAGYIGGKWFDAAKYGLMFGLVQMFASLGSAVGQPVISALLKQMSWSQLLAGFGTFGVLLTVAFVLLVRNPVSTPEQAAAEAAAHHGNVLGEIVRDLRTCLTNRQVLLAAAFAGASFGTMLAVGVLWGPRVQEARGATAGFAAVLSALAWLGLAFGAPLVNVVSDRWRSRKWPAVVGMLLQALAVALFIYGPSNGTGASMVVMLAVGVFAGTHMLGFTIAGESVPPALIGSASAIVNGTCFIVGGVLQAVPGWALDSAPDLDDYRKVLWLMPAVLVLGALAALALREASDDAAA
ncbi:MFS transporter [Conexibacter sp. JD483]|uniref:MFS transporter n=1 Tax=unclassified Conexibacter TaxID=2627773 RepID=UPI002720EAF4|nr:MULTISPECIES: MFS transporter [unclassified Conexibacter]MDO8188615.1 MFS transporter [Conexibacter sp. CPCC 205706]MDO8201505.1 MFS transporter [Conexibacter sp. CPCC 205762]MDR9370872.1 MFS transporter [Conexibacter sp. JD483]